MAEAVHALALDAIRERLDSGELTSVDLVSALLTRINEIDRHGPTIRSVIETSPDAADVAARLDGARRAGSRGPVHGVPVLLKDNIDTSDAMLTTAGSLALVDSKPADDAFVVKRLREAGAIILGKTNMSEWANFRSTHSSSGWSARVGQARNPYVLDRSPCGSSSGSASAVAAGFAPVSVGTETDGSILCPAAMCGVVGIKPTVGLTSRSGVVPISHSQDTVGTFARCIADAVAVLEVIAAPDPRDEVTNDSRRWAAGALAGRLDVDALRGARIGVARNVYFGYSSGADAVIEDSLTQMAEAGAVIIDPADIPTAGQMKDGDAELTVLLYEFKAGLNTYLKTRRGARPATLDEVIEFNHNHSDRELAYFGQEIMVMASEKGPLDSPEYVEALEECRQLSSEQGIDAVMTEHNLDALVMPTTGPAFTIDLVNGDHHSGASSGPAAMAGYPAVTVPAGYVRGLPIGITFMGRAFSEPTLVGLAYAFEQITRVWRPPTFMASLT